MPQWPRFSDTRVELTKCFFRMIIYKARQKQVHNPTSGGFQWSLRHAINLDLKTRREEQLNRNIYKL